MNIGYRISLALGISVLSSAALGQAPALNWTTNGTNGTSVTSTRGFSFNVLDAAGINVTHLTFWDNGGDGLAQSHDVGLWDSAGTLLASTTIAAGTANALDVNGKFRIGAISTVHLAQGNNYVVGAVFLSGSADLQAINMVGLTTPPQISYGQTRFNNNGSSTLSFPTSTISQIGLPGGSFQFTAVPEPATIAALGFGALAMLRRRRK
jgi:hypothetical protein